MFDITTGEDRASQLQMGLKLHEDLRVTKALSNILNSGAKKPKVSLCPQPLLAHV